MRVSSFLSLVTASVLSSLSLGQAQEARRLPVLTEALDFRLEDTSGQGRTLLEARGKVLLVFYENREGAEEQRELKTALGRFRREQHLEERLHVYGVADLRSVPSMFRGIARDRVREAAREHNISILMDFEGVLSRAPFGCRDEGAHILLFDAQGRLRARHDQALDAQGQRLFFHEVRQLLHEPIR